jgi:hypothetical protein
MNLHTSAALVLSLLLLTGNTALHAQFVLSEKRLEYKKELPPYDTRKAMAVGEDQFVLLQQTDKYDFSLIRYDKYLYEQWATDLKWEKKWGLPHLLVHGDTAIVTAIRQESKLWKLSLFRYSLANGALLANHLIDIAPADENGLQPEVLFSDDRCRFVIYNTYSTSKTAPAASFRIYDTATGQLVKVVEYTPEILNSSAAYAVHLDNEANLFVAAADPVSFKMQALYWPAPAREVTVLDNNFFFERPPDRIESMHINRLGASSYFVSISASIADELVGYNVSAYNVVLKNMLFTKDISFGPANIDSLYAGHWTVTDHEQKKSLKIPGSLQNFRLVSNLAVADGRIVLVFEELQRPVCYHRDAHVSYQTWYARQSSDKYLYGGDMLMVSYNFSGEVQWQQVLQKSQYQRAGVGGLSFVMLSGYEI